MRDDDSWLIYWSIENTGNSNEVAIKLAIWLFIGNPKNHKIIDAKLTRRIKLAKIAKIHSSSALINHEKCLETLR